MSKQTLYISQACYLAMEHAQLLLRFAEEGRAPVRRAIEDMGMLIVDHPQVTLTQPLLIALGEAQVAVILCNAAHLPSSLVLPLTGHYLQGKRVRHQLAATQPLKKQLWQRTVKAKIRQQASLLQLLGHPHAATLRAMASRVRSGDVANVEAQAASTYWPALFGSAFLRARHGPMPNAALNYGYALLRAGVARALVGSGLLLCLGIYHHNQYNAFCLADDMMEPYRPFVDLLVRQLHQAGELEGLGELSPTAKQTLLGIFHMDCRWQAEQSLLQTVLARTAALLAQCLEAGSATSLGFAQLPKHLPHV